MGKEYSSKNKEELIKLKEALLSEYAQIKAMGLSLDMSRGKPGKEQLDLSMPMLDMLPSDSSCLSGGFDCRNYGYPNGTDECRKLFADILGVSKEEVLAGGNSSLTLMYDAVARAMTVGIMGEKPWAMVENRKFLCPAPGYDRHFAITEHFGFEMITIPMTKCGPDMEMVKEYVNNDPYVKGIWCVPKYSNPEGITYSEETVRAFASLKPKAKDFRIFWDNAYAVHDLYEDDKDELINLFDECKKCGSEDMCYMFASTSKVTFPSAGVAAFATSKRNIEDAKKSIAVQSIGPDKLNQLRHTAFIPDVKALKEHMKKHALILRPRFDIVFSALEKELAGTGVAKWNIPKGGYFAAVRLMDNTAKRTVELCGGAGLSLTPAGAVYPYGIDPYDSVIRIAPSYPSEEELKEAMKVFTLSAKLSAVEKLLEE